MSLKERINNLLRRKKKEIPLLYAKNWKDGSYREIPYHVANEKLQEALYSKINNTIK